jgi:hypothetical protein
VRNTTLPEKPYFICLILAKVLYKDLINNPLASWIESNLGLKPDNNGRLVRAMEERMKVRISLTSSMQLLKTLPGVGDILAIVIGTAIGLIERFARAEQLASYAGTVPAVKSSGGKVRYGHVPKESNHYVKWAFVEAANAPAQHRKHPPGSPGM